MIRLLPFLILALRAFSSTDFNHAFEARVGLNKAGFELLLPLFSKEQKQRTDLYFELYRNKDFALADRRFKLRVKEKKEKYEISISLVDQKLAYKCGDFNIGLTLSSAAKSKRALNDLSIIRLQDDAKSFFTHLRLYDPIVFNYAKFTDRFFKMEDYLGKDEFMEKVPWRDGLFVPSKFNRKLRGKKQIYTVNKKLVELVLGKTIDVDEHGAPKIYYEIEAEGSDTPESVIDSLCHFFKKSNLKSEHISYKKAKYGPIFTLKILNLIKENSL